MLLIFFIFSIVNLLNELIASNTLIYFNEEMLCVYNLPLDNQMKISLFDTIIILEV